MLKRIWRGWTEPANADAYEDLLRSTIFPGIMARAMDGFSGIELLRRQTEAEVEFITIMTFADHDAVIRFAGASYETAVVPAAARALLSRFDDQAAHYDLRTTCAAAAA